ncbi:hypothetical protein [Salinilacihabitans rarus]|uniref:hypothetical protein n=1 Tax=Salinilacihabitans rarus TaxID=2961596 RepID=UPI0020C89D80|nr:hypothetical protein [Salinilacihabitans rarus]
MTSARGSDDDAADAGVRSSLRRAVDAVRRPAYTGERRCWPCTALNVALLAVACAAVAPWSPPAALALAVVGAAGIWLRGYLVPYTPRFAPRIAAALPGDVFAGEKTPAATGSLSGSGPDGDDEDVGRRLFAELRRAGVLEGDDEAVALSDEFRRRWAAATADLREASLDELERTVAEIAGTDGVDAFAGETRTYVAVPTPSGTAYLSQHVAIAEAAAVLALRDVAPGMDADLRVAAADPLRMFLERCPVCDAAVVETDPKACCGSVRDPRTLPEAVLACPECDVRLYAFDDG